MRDLKFELVSAHTNFRKLRRLEDDFMETLLIRHPTRYRSRLARKTRTGTWKCQENDNFISGASTIATSQSMILLLSQLSNSHRQFNDLRGRDWLSRGAGNAVYGISLTALQWLGVAELTDGQISWQTNLLAAALLLAVALIAPNPLIWCGKVLKWTLAMWRSNFAPGSEFGDDHEAWKRYYF